MKLALLTNNHQDQVTHTYHGSLVAVCEHEASIDTHHCSAEVLLISPHFGVLKSICRYSQVTNRLVSHQTCTYILLHHNYCRLCVIGNASRSTLVNHN
jgi:hypothetical protein